MGTQVATEVLEEVQHQASIVFQLKEQMETKLVTQSCSNI